MLIYIDQSNMTFDEWFCSQEIFTLIRKWRSSFGFFHYTLFRKVMNDEIQVNSHIFIIFNRLTVLEIELIKWYDFQIIDLHNNFCLITQFQLRYSTGLLKGILIGTCCIIWVFQNQWIFLKTHEHICDFIHIQTTWIPLFKSFLAQIWEIALNLIIIITNVVISIDLCDVGSEGSLMLLMKIIIVTLCLKKFNDFILNCGMSEIFLYTHFCAIN